MPCKQLPAAALQPHLPPRPCPHVCIASRAHCSAGCRRSGTPAGRAMSATRCSLTGAWPWWRRTRLAASHTWRWGPPWVTCCLLIHHEVCPSYQYCAAAANAAATAAATAANAALPLEIQPAVPCLDALIQHRHTLDSPSPTPSGSQRTRLCLPSSARPLPGVRSCTCPWQPPRLPMTTLAKPI